MACPAISVVAPLDTIDFSLLATKDAIEVAKLLHSSVTHGFFSLTLQNDATCQILEDWQDLLHITKEYFGQPQEVKMKDYSTSQAHGFKPVGRFTGAVEYSRDGYENLKVGREEVFQKSPALPGVVHDHADLFCRFISLSHYVTQTVLSSLSDALNLNGAVRLEKSHREGEPSNTILTLLHYPKSTDAASVGHNKHTDIGSLTLLFSDQWGLQVLLPDTKNWTFVQPKAGHTIVNIGDSLRFLSGKRFRSCVHRVVPPGGGCQEESRYSIAYFLRPESTAIFEDPGGNKISAGKWHDDKYVVFGDHAKQETGDILTGGMEVV